MVQLLTSVLLSAVLPLASAHVGLWTPAGFYPSGGDPDYDPVTPLANMGDSMWFHGAEKPAEGKYPDAEVLTAGGSITLELACHKDYTTMGGNAGNKEACPDGDEVWKSLHIKDPSTGGTPEYLGCALAISYKGLGDIENFNDLTPEDFTVFSVNHDCVKQRDTVFQIPKGIRSCPEGGCICSWFWQGQDSANEMYMTGFRCNVEGGTDAPIPAPSVPTKCDGNCPSGPMQPMIWANGGSKQNIGGNINYNSKPQYTSMWGFENGAQEVFGTASSSGSGSSSGSSSGSGSGSGSGSATTTSPSTPTTTSSPDNGSNSGSGSGSGSGSSSGSGSGNWNSDDSSSSNDDNYDDGEESPESTEGSGSGSGSKWGSESDSGSGGSGWSRGSGRWGRNRGNRGNWGTSSTSSGKSGKGRGYGRGSSSSYGGASKVKRSEPYRKLSRRHFSSGTGM